MKVLDADGHIVETAEDLRAFMEPPYRDTAFDIITDSKGNGFFLVEGRMIPKPAGRGCGTPRGFGGIGPRAGTARPAWASTGTGCWRTSTGKASTSM